MAIDYPQFRPTLTAADMGGFDLANAIKSGLQNYGNYFEAQYKPKNLQEALINAQQTNQINAPYAEHAQDVYNLERQQKQATLQNLLQSMQQKRQEAQQNQLFNNLLNGGETKNNNPVNSIGAPTGRPGYMTPYGFEGSLTGKPAENLYANTGPDLQAQNDALQRIDLAEGALVGAKNNIPQGAFSNVALPQNMGNVAQPQQSNLAQNINQGLQNEQVIKPGNPALKHLNDLWENYPQFRKKLKEKNIEKKEEVKNDAKTGATTITTTYPNGEITKRIIGGIQGETNGSTTPIKTLHQNSILANAAREYLAKNVVNPYAGSLSNATIAKDRLLATFGNEAAENRLIQAAVFLKTLPENAIFQLQSQNAKPTVHAIEAQKEALRQGIPAGLQTIIENLPQTTLAKVNTKYNDIINNISKVQQQTFDQGFTQSENKNSVANTQSKPKVENKVEITPEQARAELARRRAAKGVQ